MFHEKKKKEKKLQFYIEFPEMTKAETESKNLQLELPWEYSGNWRYFKVVFFFLSLLYFGMIKCGEAAK